MKSTPTLVLLISLLASHTACAEAAHLGGDELSLVLKDSPPCCVIDARKALNRAQAPLPEALPYHPGLSINPTATVVVIAEGDDKALRIARRFEKQHPGQTIVAVKGGLKAWQAASTPAADGTPGATLQFVIPHNTCETGEPLQKLQSEKK